MRGYRLPYAGYVFLKITDAAKARAALAEFIPDVITAEHWTDKPESGINLAFTYQGLRAIGLDEASLAAFPEEFRAGMASRASVLGDIGESAPEHWEAPFREGDAHVLVMISATNEAALQARNDQIRSAVERTGGAEVVVLPARRGARGRPRALRLRRRVRAAGDRGQRVREPRRARRRRGRRRRLAADQARRAAARLRGRAGLAHAGAAAGRPSARTARSSSTASCTRTWRRSGASCARRPSTTAAARRCWPPRSSGAGATGRPSTSRPIAPTRRRRRQEPQQRVRLQAPIRPA